MNPFDAAVLGIALVAVVAGFSSGLLRSLATILAYVIAAPVALALSPSVTNFLTARALLPTDKIPNAASFVPLVLLLIIAIVLGAMMRGAIGRPSGHAGLIDRLLGAVLGVVRVALVAVLLVMIFERIIPPDHEPDWLKQSQVRPYLAAAGAEGVRTLPPQAIEAIERLKKERGL
jgi:membrane protein required for colicin V production